MDDQLSLFPDDRERGRSAKVFGTPEWRRRYVEHIRSPKWRKLRQQILARCSGLCERCGKIPKRFEVHHLTYDRLGDERLTDLIALCNDPCHVEADQERAREVEWLRQERGEEARRNAARETYFRKKLGEDWDQYWYADPERLDDEFDRWWEKKQEADDDRW